ncbi:MAG: DUF1015 domain-containing protein [Candidatus Wallbacteria bacterium]|nr:DUF1015 domain-containing protein [Candidatus Wallbacteria bacterium]
MVQFKPFRALRPPPEKVQQVASVPYDVVNSAEARSLAAGNPLSLLHVSRPEIDLPEGTDLYADEVYAKGADNLERLIRECPMLTEESPSFYIYRQRMGEHVQTGIVGCCAVDDYDSDLIKKHEKTRKDKEDDRTRHILTLRAQTGPVFLTHRAATPVDRLVAELTRTVPLYDFVAPDGIAHTLWRIGNTDPVVAAFAALPCAYIADGHHRAASASRARAALRENRGPAELESDWFLAVMFPSNQLKILPYNRVVKDLNGLTLATFLQHVEEAVGAKPKPWKAGPGDDPAPTRRGECRMYLEGRWFTLPLPAPTGKGRDPIAWLDVSILMDHLLDPVLGIKDPRTDKRIDFVGGIRGTRELARLVDGGGFRVAFAMFPTTVDELMDVADAGGLMPPKSTWFEPKLRSGLVIHRI